MLFYVQKLTDKIGYMYDIAKDTRKELAKFEAAFGAKYELGSDRIDDLHPLPGEETFAQKAKRRRSSLMLNRPLVVVDHVPLTQVINYTNFIVSSVIWYFICHCMKGGITPYVISWLYFDQHKANGLTFIPVPGYWHYFCLFILLCHRMW